MVTVRRVVGSCSHFAATSDCCSPKVDIDKSRFSGAIDKEALLGRLWGFPGGAVVESLLASAGDTGSSPGLGRSHMPQSGWPREPQLLSLRVWSL
ncbi:hypothetical protein J1605_013087 [Eschrichtius robustus]|uniref:Uncharacterized protein n=1 Tax=Eschrichtius robustus TaxID=9764 RepID=A0AB34GID0_ESCRO|nr:hypothetical protein J1605_013087 [Eschrichtius robustus]